jgi:hypothetical protein
MSKVGDFTTLPEPLVPTDYFYVHRTGGLPGARDFKFSSPNLTALHNLTLAADYLPYATGAGTLDLTQFTAYGRTLVGCANAAAALTALGSTGGGIILDKANPGAIGGTIPAAITGTTINATTQYNVAGTRVIGTRRTGWTAWSGTATRTTIATGSATAQNCAEALKALIDDLIAHGVIGP